LSVSESTAASDTDPVGSAMIRPVPWSISSRSIEVVVSPSTGAVILVCFRFVVAWAASDPISRVPAGSVGIAVVSRDLGGAAISGWATSG
jgi:hypothetical protein